MASSELEAGRLDEFIDHLVTLMANIFLGFCPRGDLHHLARHHLGVFLDNYPEIPDSSPGGQPPSPQDGEILQPRRGSRCRLQRLARRGTTKACQVAFSVLS